MALEAIGLSHQAEALRTLPRIVDERTGLRAYPWVDKAQDAAGGLYIPSERDALHDRERGKAAAQALGDIRYELSWFDRELHDQDFFDKKLSWGEALGADTHWTSNVLKRLSWGTSRGEEPTRDVTLFESAVRCVERMLEITDA